MHERVFRASQAHKLEDPDRLRWLPPQEVVEALHLTAGLKIADVGAGTGFFSIPMASAVTDSGHVFAVDLQPEMLELLRQKLGNAGGPTNISLHEGSASNLPLEDGTADIVFFANVWHEIEDLDRTFQEALRVARPAGTIAILDWRSDCAPPPGPPTDHRISAASVIAFLERKACADILLRTIGPYSYLVTAGRHVAA